MNKFIINMPSSTLDLKIGKRTSAPLFSKEKVKLVMLVQNILIPSNLMIIFIVHSIYYVKWIDGGTHM